VIDEKRSQQDFQYDAVRRTALRQFRDQAPFENLQDANGQERELFVDFVDGRQKRQSEKKDQQENVNPPERRTFAIQNHTRLHAESNTAGVEFVVVRTENRLTRMKPFRRDVSALRGL
jgi:hypothetical protein